MRRYRKNCAIFILLASLAACQPASDSSTDADAADPAEPGCGDEGSLVADFYGALSASVDWRGAGLVCHGMPRPDDNGARLRFAGSVDDHPLAIIVAIPGLTRESAGAELAANVTLIEEGSRRFFSTADLDVCLAQIEAMNALDDIDTRYSVTGSVYCVAPLAEVNGESSVSIDKLRFTGLLDWSAS